MLPFISMGIPGEFRCACAGFTPEPIGILYRGPQSNPEWIVTLERE
jgi:hypothetical protein